nr:hypothetical protein [Ruminococcus flavefaciens]
MKTALIRLVKVKSIVTILLTITFCYLAIQGDINSEQLLTIFTTVIAFYFGTQTVKEDKNGKDN